MLTLRDRLYNHLMIKQAGFGSHLMSFAKGLGISVAPGVIGRLFGGPTGAIAGGLGSMLSGAGVISSIDNPLFKGLGKDITGWYKSMTMPGRLTEKAKIWKQQLKGLDKNTLNTSYTKVLYQQGATKGRLQELRQRTKDVKRKIQEALKNQDRTAYEQALKEREQIARSVKNLRAYRHGTLHPNKTYEQWLKNNLARFEKMEPHLYDHASQWQRHYSDKIMNRFNNADAWKQLVTHPEAIGAMTGMGISGLLSRGAWRMKQETEQLHNLARTAGYGALGLGGAYVVGKMVGGRRKRDDHYGYYPVPRYY